MMPVRQPQPRPQPALRHCCLITDGNSHRPDLCTETGGFDHPDRIHEALLPQIRTVATLIAAERHDFNHRSPAVFTEEADWFAARIIVLQARVFHLDVSLNAMLQTANRRAEAFARRHGLPFQAACIRASLHNKRPTGVLLMECELAQQMLADSVKNSLALCKNIGKII